MDTLTLAQSVFTHQADAYVEAGYHDITDLTESEFRDELEPLREVLDRAVADGLPMPVTAERIPFAIVVTSRLVAPSVRVAALHAPGSAKRGSIDPGHRAQVDAYAPLPTSRSRTRPRISSSPSTAVTGSARSRPTTPNAPSPPRDAPR